MKSLQVRERFGSLGLYLLWVGAEVIKGWDEAFQELHVGDQARLEIPASLAYGDKGLGKVPPNEDLVYDVEILEIISPPVPYETADRDTFKLESGFVHYIRKFVG